MIATRGGMVAVSLLVIALAGCQSERFSRLDTRAPEPLTPAPTGNVEVSQLPPPSGPLDANSFPEAPGQDGQMASLNPDTLANAPEVTPGSVAGVWNVTLAGQNCRVATPQTKYGQGYRAGPLHCPAPLDIVKSWQVDGKQLAFYDQNGQVLARLYSSGESGFSGQTSTGQPITLSR